MIEKYNILNKTVLKLKNVFKQYIKIYNIKSLHMFFMFCPVFDTSGFYNSNSE